jgi:glyoxylase-like metal-dependent hydrolase (beta-lactamase superfamily II)
MSTSWFTSGVRIDLLAEDEGPFNSVEQSLPGLSAEALARDRRWLDHHGYDAASHKLVLSFHSYLVRVGGKNVIVDSCVGNDKALGFRPAWDKKSDTRWLAALLRAGVEPEQVHLVINTHLHLDHVGWNTSWTGPGWVPTFPNARYIVPDLEYRAARERASAGGSLAELHRVSLSESVEPLERHGVLDLVPASHRIDDDIRLVPTPGHTRGHVAVVIGADAVAFTGDLLHSPIQAADPELHWAGDEDPELAAQTRRDFLERYVDSNTLVCTMHFPGPSAGHVRRAGTGYRLQPVTPPPEESKGLIGSENP